jgi:hypothetical protein
MSDLSYSLSQRTWLGSAASDRCPDSPAASNPAKPMAPSKPRLDPDRLVGAACITALLIAIILI